ncbi:sentrin-specific protease 7-like isoform X2 [Synchiropus splendidus]|uniref:sentrin-specific protease 7-like isoform X2 n=1 Tax=Synchiropus splendidus TaxID=270530 RepID=UPI00237E8FFC|nr:sentrin-specific protease 7-like isoform X2 [Synchiropus splendidus]
MTSHFKIPKKKQSSDCESPRMHIQSPLSRLQIPAPEYERYGGQSSCISSDRVNAKESRVPAFRDVVKTLLGLNTSGKPREVENRTIHSQPALGWRPKRASDRFLPDESLPPQKKLNAAAHPAQGSIAERQLRLSREEQDGSSSSAEEESLGRIRTKDVQCNSSTSDEDLVVPGTSAPDLPSRKVHTPSRSSTASMRRGLNQTSWLRGITEREKWRAIRNKTISRPPVLVPQAHKHGQSEPIVLSSDEEEDEPHLQKSAAINVQAMDPSSFLKLEFCSLHAGMMTATADGSMMITESGITLPLKESEDCENRESTHVTVVASQLRGYGVWDGGVAKGGTLLAGWEGPAPSLLFLWVTEAQAYMLHRELTPLQTTTPSDVACGCLILLMKEQLQEVQVALLASILELEEYKKGRSANEGHPPSPLDWSDGLLLLYSCPAPVDQHLLSLLGHSDEPHIRIINSSQKFSSRLLQYPPPPSKGRISVSQDDLFCLQDGEFLNDVIVDFYLKYLFLEGVGRAVAERSHIFCSFFYKQLSRKRAAGEDCASIPDAHTRHQRVKTWTRHVDIFTKDFLFVPVNHESHWFLVVVCFPALEDSVTVQLECASGEWKPALTGPPPPDCSSLGCRKRVVVRRPCLLIMDSLKTSMHNNICRLLREYLQEEWLVRRGNRRVFSNMTSSHCRVPQQDNSSDCGVFLLHYVEMFLKNPIVHFELPPHLDHWFPRQQVRVKREQIRQLIMRLHKTQQGLQE